VDLGDLDPTFCAHRFTVTTAEIEEVICPPSSAFLKQFLVVEVVSVQPHPNADKLRCCKVSDGQETWAIVCGASNVREGLLTVLAPMGCDFGDFKIKKTKLRGELSEGMLCSEKELTIGSDDSGLVELNSPFTPGQHLDEVYSDLGFQWDLDNKAITHRPDLWGHHGLARDLGAVFKREVKSLELASLDASGHLDYSVKIAVPDLCRRYCGLSIVGVQVQQSPRWMRDLLKEVGLTPINNVVDASNFVMLELGQPTHAFDQSKLSSRSLSVDLAKDKESFEALNGKKLELCKDDVVVRSGDEIVALAGVIGGQETSVDAQTTEIFIESAHFAPLNIRKTAKTYDQRTDASSRFEKSLDPEHAPMAIARLVTLLRETCPQLELCSGLIDCYPNPIEKRVIELNPTFVKNKLGFDIPEQEQLDTLDRLGFKVKGEELPWKVEVPSFRNTKDIEEAIDLVEEVGRIAGYDRLLPCSPSLSLEAKPPRVAHLNTRRLQDSLVSLGYSEVKSYSFASEEELLALDWLPRAMKLANPMTKEQAFMRPGLLVRQMEIWALNSKHLDRFSMFEFGVVFERSAERDLPDERMELMVSRYGESDSAQELYQLKADVHSSLMAMGVTGELSWSKADMTSGHDAAHPARVGTLKIDGERAGYLAELHPAIGKRLGLKKRLSFAVVDAPLSLCEAQNVKFQGLDRFPAVPFSCSFVVDDRTTVGEVMACVQSVDRRLIQDLRWVGNYCGESIAPGKVSVTLSMNFRRSDRTMSGDEIQTLQSAIVEKADRQNYKLRDS
jgi:phenylalanyl-tRNA synthetase beta chain